MMRSLPLLRSLRRGLVAAAALALFAGVASAADEPRQVVRDPHYGDGLFHFYQARYFTSITSLMASQHFGRVSQHADEAEVLRGGMLLSYGLHREAGQIFAQLIERGAPPSVRNRAWFFLAKIRYQRGLNDQAEEALARIDAKLPGELEDERGLLAANLLLAKADYAAAATLLDALVTRGGAATPYARYNLGVALLKSEVREERQRGEAILEELGRGAAANEELRSLRDKANVALGFAALHESAPVSARSALERVRLVGLQSNKALLGFGWAAVALKDPKLALVPWAELASRDTSDSAVLEAKIAVPYAFAELGALGQALDGYNTAIADFESESRGLDATIAAVREGKLIDGLIERNPGEEMGWFWNIDTLPEMPHGGHLSQVLAQHEFQEAFKNFRDLRFLANNLQDWHAKLDVFGAMLDNRRDAYVQRLPQLLAKLRDVSLKPLQQRREALAAELERAQAEADGSVFADAKQRELMARLASVQDALKAFADDREFAPARARARLAAGALIWQLAQDYPARVWQAKKGLRDIDSQLEQTQKSALAFEQAQRDEPQRHAQFATRIAALAPRIQALIPVVAALSREQQGEVQEMAVAALEQQKQRLAVYTTQARFAVAQLYDRATVSKADGDAGKR